MTVERNRKVANGERSFFKLFRLPRYRDTQAIYVEGKKFVLISTLPHIEGDRLGHANEVTAVIAGLESKYDSTPVHGLERFPIEEVLCVREIKIISPKSPSSAHQTYAYAPGELFCKSVLFLEYRNREEWQSVLTKISGSLRPMKPRECDKLPPSTMAKMRLNKTEQLLRHTLSLTSAAPLVVRRKRPNWQA